MAESDFYAEAFAIYKKVQANGSANRVENGNENAGNPQPQRSAPANNPRYVSPDSLIDNVNTRYQQ
jgi:hypothetical protein